MKIDRLLSIVLLLLNREKVTAPYLAGYFETSIRTIYRDIDTLCIAGIPIVSQQGTGGGYSLSPNFKMDRQVFTPDELLALITGLKGVESAFRDKTVSSAMEKVTALVPEIAGTEKSVVIDFSSWDRDSTHQEIMSALYRAVLSHRRVRFEYANLQNETTERTVEPIQLMFKMSAWYLLGFCLLKNNYRFFRVSRIHKPVVLDETFREHDPASINMDTEWRSAPPVELHLRFPEEARGRLFGRFPEQGIKYNDDGTIEVRVVYPLDEWVYGLLLGFADIMEVLSPESVRNELLRRTGIFREKNA
ncbi:MAG: YafY family transcriptional regulator [Spirochaetales bacterium]|nr:YafY family transcriptional regulator [Spirochaetales bacterium]